MKKNYYIIFDTNVIWGKPLQRDFLELRDYIRSIGLKIGLYLPETVKEEFKKKIIFELSEALERYNSSINDLEKFDYLQIKSSKKIEADEKIIKKRLDTLLKDNGLEIIPVPYAKISLEKLLEQAVYYLPPFEKNEKGFKDSVIAETILAAIESFDKDAIKVFVSNDKNLRQYIASCGKELLIYESVKDLESMLRADIQDIGDIDEMINQADKIFYAQLHGDRFFEAMNDFKSLLREKYTNILEGYTISYDTIDPHPGIEKYLKNIIMTNDDILKIKGNPFFEKKEGKIFFWESNVAMSRIFYLPLPESGLANNKIEYNLNFVVKWKATLTESKLVSPELIEIEYAGHNVMHEINRFFPEISRFSIYPSETMRREYTYS